MSVKIIHLAKDNEIDGMECADCGAHLRHALEINGVIYGMDCGAKRLGWGTSKARIAKKASALERAAYMFKWDYENWKNGKRAKSWAEYSAGRVCELLGLTISKFDPEFLEKVLEQVK